MYSANPGLYRMHSPYAPVLPASTESGPDFGGEEGSSFQDDFGGCTPTHVPPAYRQVHGSSPLTPAKSAPAHSALEGHCQFFEYPTQDKGSRDTDDDAVELDPSQKYHRLFIGQVRFESNMAELRHIIRLLVNVEVAKFEIRGLGCFVAFLTSEADASLVQSLHRRVLFDRTGFWYARTPAEVETMLGHVDSFIATKGKASRLPRDAMVVEAERGPQRPRASSHPPATPSPHPMPQVQPAPAPTQGSPSASYYPPSAQHGYPPHHQYPPHGGYAAYPPPAMASYEAYAANYDPYVYGYDTAAPPLYGIPMYYGHPSQFSS